MPIKRAKKTEDQASSDVRTVRTKRTCLFCDNKKQPNFTDSQTLRRFVSDRSKIVPRARSGACGKHQRQISDHIKYARHLALLPFINQA